MPSTDYDDDPPPPPGVTLRDPEDTETTRQAIESEVSDGFRRYVDGFSYGGVGLRLKNLHYADPPKYSQAEQDRAKLEDRTLARRLRGTVELVDTATNEVLDTRRKVTLARVPWLTPRGTVIHGGSEYGLPMQSRLLPGAYARKRDNGELEMHFNTRPGTGSAMRLTLDPTTGQYRLKIGTSDLHAYSVFRDLGVSDDELAARWGSQVLEMNRKGYSKDALDRAYAKAVPKWERDPMLPREQKVAAITAALNRAQASESILRSNLPHLFDQDRLRWLRSTGQALEKAASLARFDDVFQPDLTPDAVADRWAAYDFALEAEMGAADYLGIEKHAGADYRKLPDHWQREAWLDWYAGYHAGHRGPDDMRKAGMWAAFRREHGGRFMVQPSPVRAIALETWAIDPARLLKSAARADFEQSMRRHLRVEKTKWLVRSRDFGPEDIRTIVKRAAARGVPTDNLMKMASAGSLNLSDFSDD